MVDRSRVDKTGCRTSVELIIIVVIKYQLISDVLNQNPSKPD